MVFFFFKQKTAYEMRISDWSSDVCSSDLADPGQAVDVVDGDAPRQHAAGGVVGQVVELQHQAFAEITRTHADRVQALDLVQHGQHFVRAAPDLGQQRLRDHVERFAQVAVVVDRVDQHQADAVVAIGHL